MITNSDSSRFAFTVTMGPKGQIVIPAKAREVFNYNPGDTILLLGDIERGLAIVKPEDFNELYSKMLQKGE